LTSARGRDAASLLRAVRDGDFIAMARAITAIENRSATGTELAVAVRGRAGGCRTIGVTGPPGAGKSSLINSLVQEWLPRFRRIAVVTVDPSSPISGGAVLGDRVRMAEHSANPAVFIRSLSARGHLGGVTRTTRSVMDLLAAGGMDLVIIETVGTGQSEVEVAELTEMKVVVCAPGLGDEMQAIKAGVLEIADLLVVNKADLPDAARTAAHLKAMLHHRGHDERRSVLSVSTIGNQGVSALARAIEQRLGTRPSARSTPALLPAPSRAMLAADVADAVARIVLDRSNDRIDAIVRDINDGMLSRAEAAHAALAAIADLVRVTEAGSIL